MIHGTRHWTVLQLYGPTEYWAQSYTNQKARKVLSQFYMLTDVHNSRPIQINCQIMWKKFTSMTTRTKQNSVLFFSTCYYPQQQHRPNSIQQFLHCSATSCSISFENWVFSNSQQQQRHSATPRSSSMQKQYASQLVSNRHITCIA